MTHRTCSVPGCTCVRHARRGWYYGSATATTRRYRTHGRHGDPNYDRHKKLMYRCYNPEDQSFENYGGRGIRVYEPWHDVAVFCDWIAANLGPCPEGHSLDRVDNDGHYEPGNVRWASASEQMFNRRSSRLTTDLTCVSCGGSFSSPRAHALYCSPRCQNAAKRARRRSRELAK